MLGKTFKGLTDAMLAWQTEDDCSRSKSRATPTRSTCGRSSWSRSPSTTSRRARIILVGLALRFARVKRYRADKTAAEADTFQTVQSIYRQT